ncbi:MAG: VPLPA-CTERM sorting domain-containing protein [Acidobacteriota bacterium]
MADGTFLTGRDTACFLNPAPYNVPGCVGFGSGWVIDDPSGDSTGVMNPTIGPAIGNDPTLYPMFPSIPEGEQIGYSNGTPFYQVLSEIITANTTYTLNFWAGARQDVGAGGYYENQGYYGELSAATGNGLYSGRTILTRTSNNVSLCCFNAPSINAPDAPKPGFGQWLLVSIAYSFGANDPLIGQHLMVAFGSPAVQASFDAISVDATSNVQATPEPATFVFVLAGLGGIQVMRRRRKQA